MSAGLGHPAGCKNFRECSQTAKPDLGELRLKPFGDSTMKLGKSTAAAILLGVGLLTAAPLLRGQSNASQAVRPVGVVTEVQPGKLTLHTDAGPSMAVEIPEGARILRVPPGAKDLKSATPIGVEDIAPGDRVFIRGDESADQKSVVAKSVIVMSRASLAVAHREEAMEWQQRGIGGVVKALDPAAKQITVAVPNTPPTPANPTHPVVITLAANAVVLRYAPDSVKFSDAKPSTIDEIKEGDQVRALGTKSQDGANFTAEKLVSGTFRNIGATVISVDAAAGTMTVKDLASGQPLLVRTNPESKLHTLPPFVAMMIARFNSGAGPGGGRMPAQPAAQGGGGNGSPPAGGYRREQGSEGAGARTGGPGGMARGMNGGPPHDFNQMLDRMPALSLAELKPGQALIVVSTEGAKPSEVNAIAVLAGVEPILQARPKGSNQVVLGPWNMSIGGGGGEEGP
jgi:hypothetical protein